MHRKFVFTALIMAVTLITWIYWSSNVDTNNTLLVLRNSKYFLKEYLIEPTHSICKRKPYLIILVTSYVGHVELRSAHRRAMPADLLNTMNIARIFLLAKVPPMEKYINQRSIIDESSIYGDILQGSFLEHYRNLTHKHLMGLQWAATVCTEASYILKVDDDIVFNLNKTYKFLLNLDNRDNFLIGYMLNNTKPKRNKQNKWYVTWDEYPRNNYPPYLSGWYYITIPKVALQLCEEAIYHPHLWIDDIFVTGILTETLNIQLRQLPINYWLEYYELLECCLRDMINKFIKCDYVVGPNGGRNNLIVEYNEALRNCDNWKNCTTRTANKPLNKVCVAYKERDIFSDGQAEVQFIKL